MYTFFTKTFKFSIKMNDFRVQYEISGKWYGWVGKYLIKSVVLLTQHSNFLPSQFSNISTNISTPTKKKKEQILYHWPSTKPKTTFFLKYLKTYFFYRSLNTLNTEITPHFPEPSKNNVYCPSTNVNGFSYFIIFSVILRFDNLIECQIQWIRTCMEFHWIQ